MKNIKCETSNCEHNIKCRCLAGVIAVGENAKCLSRVKREGGSLAQSFADVEAGEDIFDGGSAEVIVQCSCGCAFNSGGVCSCESIDVQDGLTPPFW
ncbi:MAG: DUF1540 domain-containing protein [Clostridia bacterium]